MNSLFPPFIATAAPAPMTATISTKIRTHIHTGDPAAVVAPGAGAPAPV